MPRVDPLPLMIEIIGRGGEVDEEVSLLQKEIASEFQHKGTLFVPYASSEPMPPETGGGGEERVYELVVAVLSGGFVGTVSTNLVQTLLAFLNRNRSYKMTLKRGDVEFTIEGVHPDKAVEYARRLFPREFDLPDPDAG